VTNMVIDDSVEKERARRKAYIKRIRKENDEAPRPQMSALERLQARERQREREAASIEDEPHGWCGVRARDMTDTERADVLIQGQRNASVQREGEELIYKTVCPNRELTSDPNDNNAAWNEVDQRIANAIARERQFIIQIIGESIGSMLSEARRKDKHELADEVRKLWTVISELQHTLHSIDRAAEYAKTVDLPNPLRPRSSVN